MQIKGVVFGALRSELRALTDLGHLSREDLERSIQPEDLALLEQPIVPGRWYPIPSLDRLLMALSELAGHGSEDYLVELGRQIAGPLLAAVTAPESDPASSPACWWSRVGHSLVSLPSSLFSETSWTLIPGDDRGRFVIQVTGARELPESCRLSTQGTLEVLATRLVGVPVEVSSERADPDRVVFRGRPGRPD